MSSSEGPISRSASRAARRLKAVLHEVNAFLTAENDAALECWTTAHARACEEAPLDAALQLWWMATDLANDGTDRLRLVPEREAVTDSNGGGPKHPVDFVVEPVNPVLLSLMRWRGLDFKVAVQLERRTSPIPVGEDSTGEERYQARTDDGWTVFRVSAAALTRDGANCVQDIYIAAIERLLEFENALVVDITGMPSPVSQPGVRGTGAGGVT